MLGVSCDSPETQAKFKVKHKLNFPLLSDKDQTVVKAYGVWRQKSFLGRKYMGIERTTFLIDGEGSIKKIFEKVKAKGHAADVLETL